MKPGVRAWAREVVSADWVFTPDSSGSLSSEQITAAAALETARQLRYINQKLDNLGSDGIHQLIRESLKETRAKAKAHRAKARKAKVPK